MAEMTYTHTRTHTVYGKVGERFINALDTQVITAVVGPLGEFEFNLLGQINDFANDNT